MKQKDENSEHFQMQWRQREITQRGSMGVGTPAFLWNQADLGLNPDSAPYGT